MKKIIRLTENDLVRLTKKIINETKKENNIFSPHKYSSASFYDSNYDKIIRVTENGWYVGFRTKSGDIGFVKVDREPKDNKDAMDMLKKINPDEVYSYVTKIAQVQVK